MTQAYPQPTIELAAQTDLSQTERHRLLSSERRRRILAIMENRTSPISCDELATTLAVAELGGIDPDEEVVTELTISLHHSHLPAMDDLGVISYDPTTNMITTGGR